MTMQDREAEVARLIAMALNPSDPYDGHHGTDRSEDSLEWLRENDPTNYLRILAKIAADGS